VSNEWTRENGKEKLWYAENAVGRIYFTSPMSTLQPGYVLRSTTSPREMDRLFNRMHEQEREQNERFIEKMFNRGRAHFDGLRSALRDRLVTAGVSDGEKNIIRASLKLMDQKDEKMKQNTVYGVSAMQETEAPLPGGRTKVM
jgi:hypothetical protein